MHLLNIQGPIQIEIFGVGTISPLPLFKKSTKSIQEKKNLHEVN